MPSPLGNVSYYNKINPNNPFIIGKRAILGSQGVPYKGVNILQNDNLIPVSGVRVNPDVLWNYPAQTYSDTIVAGTSYTFTKEIYFQNYKGNIVNFEVDNNSGQTINGFKIQLKDAVGGEWYDYVGNTDFGTVTNNMLFSTNPSPNALTNGQKGHARVKIDSAYGARFAAQVAASSGNVTVQASFE